MSQRQCALIPSQTFSESRSRDIETCKGIAHSITVPWRSRWQRKLAQVLPPLGTVLSARNNNVALGSQMQSLREVHGVALKEYGVDLIFSKAFPERFPFLCYWYTDGQNMSRQISPFVTDVNPIKGSVKSGKHTSTLRFSYLRNSFYKPT